MKVPCISASAALSLAVLLLSQFFLYEKALGAPMSAVANILYPADTNSLVVKAAFIRGTTKGDAFLRYKLSYRSAQEDDPYQPIYTGYNQVDISSDPDSSGMLGVWDTADDTLGLYWVLLEVFTAGQRNSEDTTRDSVKILVTPNPGSRFRLMPTEGEYSCVANYSDYNNDHEWEILYGDDCTSSDNLDTCRV